MPEASRIWTPMDFSADGKQISTLRLPQSTDLSAYGWHSIPAVCIRNGDGPTALLIAGTHGDEYEGQIALMNLVRAIAPKDVRGRIIVLPSVNYPAVEAGRRVSPLDEGNLNRLYPGRADGTPTQMIAHYITTQLLPMADLVIDLHSGGRSLDYVNCALIRAVEDPKEQAELIDLVRVFGAPFAYITDGSGGGGNTTLPATAEALGVPVITTELGGGATLRDAGRILAEEGTLRLLKHIGLLPSADVPSPSPTRLMTVPDRSFFLYADADGLFEPAAVIGEMVEKGSFAGVLHPLGDMAMPPLQLVFPRSGLVSCRRFPTLSRRGDCLFGLMKDVGTIEIGIRQESSTH